MTPRETARRLLACWSVLALVAGSTVTGVPSPRALCNFRIVFAGTCEVTCIYYGVNGDVSNPGHAAAAYLANAFANNADDCLDAWNLVIRESVFPSNRLAKDWLSGGTTDPLPPINSVLLHTVSLESIADGAFDMPEVGPSLNYLGIYSNPFLNQITWGMMEGLTRLNQFEWVSNGVLTHAAEEALFPFHQTLQVLHIGDSGTSRPEVLANMTGFCHSTGSNLPSLLTLDMGHNPGQGLEIIGRRHFSKLVAVQAMYLWNSDIYHVQDKDVFADVGDTLQALDLANNMLTTLPVGTLDSVIEANNLFFTLMLEGNPWHCDCHLQWLQDVVNSGQGGILLRDSPKCESPASEAGKLLTQANMQTVSSCNPALPPASPPLIVDCSTSN